VKQSDKTCWQPHCKEFSAPDFCAVCEDDYFLHQGSGLCVEDCSEAFPGLENDEENNSCRQNCAVGEYNDPSNNENCLSCVADGKLT